MIEDKIYFSGEVRKNGLNGWTLHFPDANFNELSNLLTLVKMIENKILQRIFEIRPDFYTERKG